MGISQRKPSLLSSFLILISFVLFSVLNAQPENSNKPNYVLAPSLVNSDLKVIHFFSSENGVACGKQILIYKKGEWIKYPKQPPVEINLFFPLDTNSFFITSDNKYQESDLFFGENGKWNKVWIPIAGNIFSMNFTDRENGVIAGLGEIVLLKNSHWQWLTPPTNNSIINVLTEKDSIIWAHSYEAGLFKYNGKWNKIKGSEQLTHIQLHQHSIYVLGHDFIGFVNSHDSLTILLTDKRLLLASSFYVQNDSNMTIVGQKGSVMRLKNGQLWPVKSGVKENLNAAWMVNDQKGWIVGNDGVILEYSTGVYDKSEMDRWKGFKKVTLNAYAKVVDDEYGVVASDFNKDGLVDIFTCGLFESNHLYINSGNNKFTDKAQQWHVVGEESDKMHLLNLGACAGDLDNDGDEDLFVTALNGRNKLYKNIRSNYFIDYSAVSHCTGQENDRTNAAIFGDVDNDGDLDIFITNENSSNRLFLNNGAGIFTETTEPAGLDTDFGGTGCSFGDIDNDGDLDLYVANWSAKNILYRNLLQETGQLVFENITQIAGVGGEFYSKSNGVVFSDIDNDADLDLYVTNRKTSNKLYLNNGNGLFTDKTTDFIGEDSLKSYGAVITDFDGDGYKDIYVNNVGDNVFYKNMKGKGFADQTAKYNIGIGGYSTGSAIADFDDNGSPDIYVANFIGESSALLMNQMNNQHFIKVKIRGIKNNSSGIGTKVFIYSEKPLVNFSKHINYTEISGGSGYASMNQRFLPITIPGQDFVDIKVVFPRGEIKTLKHVKAGSSVIVEDETGMAKVFLLTSRYLLLYVNDSEKLLLFLAWLFILIVIAITVAYGLKKFSWSPYFIIVIIALLLFVFYFQTGYFAYRNIWLSIIMPILSVMILITLNLFFFERKRIKKVAAEEMEQTQRKLSRDLHDDLGSTVSTIGIYLTLIRYNLKSKENKLDQLLDKTAEMVNSAASAITDMVWAVNPKPESLEDLIFRIQKNFIAIFHERGIQFTVNSNTETAKILLNYKIKQNIYLIVKEAINNTLKYADATAVEIVVKKQGQGIHIAIKDNGKGFHLSSAENKGHGLINMQKRTEEIKAGFEIITSPNNGTEINLIFRMD